MPDPVPYRPAPGAIPDQPGVYKFRDEHRRVIYVGKAKSLRSRLNSYFADPAGLHPRTAAMVHTAAAVEWTVVSTEVEALQLEYAWIKEFDPRFNVRYRDDKSYPYLAVTVDEEYPRLQVLRGERRRGVRYFGPYAHAWAIRETLDLLLRVFPARTCSSGVFKRAAQVGRPCLLGYIDKCSAPCTGRVSADQHRGIVEDFCDFMAGRTDAMIRRLEKEMSAAAADLDFERAARVRDDLGALRRAVEKQTVVLGDGTDADVVGVATDELEAAVQVFFVRGGRVRGQRGWVVDITEQAGVPELLEQFCSQLYGGITVDDAAPAVPAQGPDSASVPHAESAPPGGPSAAAPGAGGAAALQTGPGGRSVVTLAAGPAPAAPAGTTDLRVLGQTRGTVLHRRGPDAPRRRRRAVGGDGAQDVPRELLLPALPSDAEALGEWLSVARGSRVDLRVPQRGDKRALLETVTRNAEQSLRLHKLKRASDLTSRSRALQEVQDALGLDSAPLRIECFDVSHVQGSDVVASMVVFEDGLARRSEYRRFALRQVDGGDDTAWMAEVISRRFSRYLDERAALGDLVEPPPRWTDAPSGTAPAPDGEPATAAGTAPAGASPDGAGPVRAGGRARGDDDAAPPGGRKFAYPPQLVVVDGGPPQVAAAAAALADLGIDDVALCGLAKRLEEVWLPGEADPVILPRTSEALYLLQRVRDEAHRFAITYHRAKRSQRMQVSALDDVPGLGQSRRSALLRHFGSVKRLRAATVEEVAEVPGIGPRTAAAVVAALGATVPAAGAAAAPAVDPATGEVLG